MDAFAEFLLAEDPEQAAEAARAMEETTKRMRRLARSLRFQELLLLRPDLLRGDDLEPPNPLDVRPFLR